MTQITGTVEDSGHKALTSAEIKKMSAKQIKTRMAFLKKRLKHLLT